MMSASEREQTVGINIRLGEYIMIIAATYDNGQIFQHFGRTESFKLYEVEDGKILSSKVVSSNGEGHEALAGVLDSYAVNVLVCGGIGEGAQSALSEVSIEVCAGAQGDADAAVEAYLRGELISTGVNCDHHEEEHSCGSGCGGSCGGCGHHAPAFEGKNVGKTVRAHYRGTFNDGEQFDSSYDRGEPLEFVCGAGMMILGFDKAVANMEVGQVVDVHLMPEEAYGPKDPNAIFSVPINELEGSADLDVDDHVLLYNTMGQPFQVVVVAKDDVNITFDANHEMAGKELNFRIELVEVK